MLIESERSDSILKRFVQSKSVSKTGLLRTSVLQMQGFSSMASAQQRRASDYFKALVRLFAELVLRFPTAELPPLPVRAWL